jgi:tetratricopeptide (TPR) repeat protein
MLEVFSGSAEDITKKITNEPIHLLHAQKLCANAKEIGYVSDRLLQLKVCMLQCIMTVFRDFDAAQPLLEDIDNDLNAGLPLAPYYEALLKANKGFLAHNQANHDLAIQFMNESLAILEPYNEHDEEKLRAITNLIQYRAMRGEWVKTENLIENGRKIFKNLSCYSCQCFFIYAWAMVLNDQGKFQQALNVLGEESAYPMLSIEYPPIYQGIVLQKIESLIKLGRFDEANTHAKELKRKLEEFYAKKTAVLGYMLTLKSMSFLRHKNKRPQAFDMINEAIEIYNTSFQGSIKHRAQGRSHLALGKAYATQKDFPNALKAYRMSEHIYNTVLENKKIDDVSELYTDLAILGARMKDEALVHEYLKNHIQIFGRTHPRTKEILLFLSQNGLAVPL